MTFKNTYLYVKKHNQTELMYFGKTTRDPLKYKGSGKYWLRHLKKHGNDITTLWTKLFFEERSLIEFAKNYSTENDIFHSEKYANCIEENGLDGKP